MTIERSETGPVFRVTDEESGETFVGTSPTKPWTAVCVRKNLKTRIRCVLYKRISPIARFQHLIALSFN